MTRLFPDANVLFTAARRPAGKAAFIIVAAPAGRWRVITSAYAWREAERNLRTKFPQALAHLNGLNNVERLPAAEYGPCSITLPEKDQPIFAAACHARATHLLTGDHRDFGRYMNKPARTAGILIQTVADFIDSI